ncbi:unnamed protein product [Larinioides sclopetarius]|uniref:Uncharacterized protein n=1 Tax=Larinioides sclopetarius TaxID=280406 RepID=A0AAV2AGF7_9ARAC
MHGTPWLLKGSKGTRRLQNEPLISSNNLSIMLIYDPVFVNGFSNTGRTNGTLRP